MSDQDQPALELRLDQRQPLSASWLLRLVRGAGYDVPQTSLSMTPFIIGQQNGFHIKVMSQDSTPWITAESSDPSCQQEIDQLVRCSGELASVVLRFDDDFGGYVWYQCTLAGEKLSLASPMFQSRLQERLHTTTPILGWRRLGRGVLLNFRVDESEGERERSSPSRLCSTRGRSWMPTSPPWARSMDLSPVPWHTRSQK
jgi:hypothetical protein